MTKDQLVNTLEALDVEQFKQAITLISTCRKLYIHAPSSAEGGAWCLNETPIGTIWSRY